MEAFYAVLPVFLLIAVGAAVHMTDVLPENTGAAMGLYVLKLALPVLMLHILSGASRLDLAHGGFWLGVIGAQMLCYLLGYAVDRLFSRRGTGPAIISGLACSASNTAFVGLPIVAGLLPGNHEAMVVAGLAALTPNVVVIMAQIRMDCLAGSAAWGDGRGRIWKLLRLFLLGNPLLLATLAGLALLAVLLLKRKKKSRLLLSRITCSPLLILCAFTTISLSDACRKIFLSSTTGNASLRMISRRTFPGPTLGS